MSNCATTLCPTKQKEIPNSHPKIAFISKRIQVQNEAMTLKILKSSWSHIKPIKSAHFGHPDCSGF